MSAAKMVADSTQGDVPEMASTKKRKKMVQKKKVKKRKESAKKGKKKVQQEDEFNDSDLDLDREVYPIGYYVKDRDSLLEQMFHCVRGQSLNRALPDALKELPVEDLKRRCMEQLEVMSKKRIRRILAGDDPASISSSGTEDETSEEEVQEMDEGGVDYESIDSQVVDSTSYTLENADSDRDVEYDDGSVGHSNHSNQSPYLSDVDQDNLHQYEENTYASDEETQMGYDHSDTGHAREQSPGTPETPEEGEVFDDNSDVDEQNAGVTNDNSEPKVVNSNSDQGVVSETSDQDVVADKSNDNSNSGVTSNDNTEKDKCKHESNDSEKQVETEVSGEVDINDGKVDEDVADNVEKTALTEANAGDESKVIEGSKETVENETKDDVSTQSESGDDKSDKVDKGNESEIRVVTTETTKVHGEDKDVKDVEVTECLEDQITVESDCIIDEEAANIGAEHGEGDSKTSDEGEVSENSKAPKKTEKPAVVETKKAKQPRRVVKPPTQDIAPALTRNQMELLELEMRARAIKAMLKTAK